MTNAEFKPGDIVELADGTGPRMILEQAEAAGWRCAWSVYGAVRLGVFPPDMLRHYQKRPRSKRVALEANSHQ